MEVPNISSETHLTLAQAKREYRKLVKLPVPPHGWASWLETKIQNRLTFLRTKITDYVCFKETKK